MVTQDTPFLKDSKRNKEAWAKEDTVINQKLADLEKRFGKKPNIIYILADDVGWGELGWQGGGKHRGAPTHELDKMAFNGMRFWSAYAEPSCTPSRIALMTGRHPVRTGLLSVLWPGQEEGLCPQEVCLPKVLSSNGYSTAMWGKWHLGEKAEYSPVKHGFEYAYYGLYNGAPYSWPDSTTMYKQDPPGIGYFFDFPGEEEYYNRTGIRLSPGFYQENRGEERVPKGEVSRKGLANYEEECHGQIINYIRDQAGSDKPFFIYWATFTEQITGASDYMNKPGVDSRNANASFMVRHQDHIKDLFKTLNDTGIAENTLVVWISDNGPMYAFEPTAGYSWLRGEKGEVLEGGVRVPAMAVWPGMIEPNQDPVDILHITDLFTTAASIAGVKENIPSDRITDGIDQTALLLMGEGHGRRNYMFHYSGDKLAAVRYRDHKVHLLGGSHGGLPTIQVYNVKRDPSEKFQSMFNSLYVITPLQNLVKDHYQRIREYPHRKSVNMPEGSELTPHD